jgi:hypothetical protein
MLLGPHGNKKSKAQYERVLAEWWATGRRAGPEVGLTGHQIILAYWEHAKAHYVGADGEPTNELVEIRDSLMPLKAL